MEGAGAPGELSGQYVAEGDLNLGRFIFWERAAETFAGRRWAEKCSGIYVGKRNGQGEKLGCDLVAIEVSAVKLGWPWGDVPN